MNELLQLLMQKTGLSQEAARKVVDVILILRAFPNAQVQLAHPDNFEIMPPQPTVSLDLSNITLEYDS